MPVNYNLYATALRLIARDVLSRDALELASEVVLGDGAETLAFFVDVLRAGGDFFLERPTAFFLPPFCGGESGKSNESSTSCFVCFFVPLFLVEEAEEEDDWELVIEIMAFFVTDTGVGLDLAEDFFFLELAEVLGVDLLLLLDSFGEWTLSVAGDVISSSKISMSEDLRFLADTFFLRGARFLAGDDDAGSAKGETSFAIGEMLPRPLSKSSEGCSSFSGLKAGCCSFSSSGLH